MDDDDASPAASSGTGTAAPPPPPLNGSAADYSPDDEDLDEAAAAAAAAAEATRDTLADGLVARLLRPCVDCLDASVQCTRMSQLDLKLQLDSLAAELKRLSLAQHDYLFAASALVVDKNVAQPKTTTNTCVLLDGYARRLCDARAKIAVVGNILESTQDRLRALSHRIGREHNNRKSLLEPSAVVNGLAAEDPKLDDTDHKLKFLADDDNDDSDEHNKNDNYQQQQQADDSVPSSEPPKSS